MAFDESLAARIRALLPRQEGLSEQKMFGGIAFLIDGKMFCGIVKSDLMVRVGPDAHQAALATPHVRPMDFTGRPMKGYVYVAPAGCKTDAALGKWLQQSFEYAVALPAKKSKPPRRHAGA